MTKAERLLARGKTTDALDTLREAMRLGRVPVGRAAAMLTPALQAGDGRLAGQVALLLMDHGYKIDSGLVGRAAGLLDAAGEPRDALALLEARRACGPLADPEALHLGDLLRRQGRFEDALSIYDTVLKDNPAASAALADRAETYLRMGRPREAEEAARDALTRIPGSRAARLVLARSLAAEGKVEAAIAEYRKLLGDKP